MSKLRVGLLEFIIAGRPSADTVTRANFLSARAAGIDSFWVPDHLNALFPRSLWQPKYCGAAKILPSADAYMEPWTMLGNIAARNRISRVRLGVAVTDTGRRNPAVTAQAATTLHLLTKGRAILGIGTGEREGNEPYGVDWSKPVARFEEALATIRALWDSNGELVNRGFALLPVARCNIRSAEVPRKVAGNLDRSARSAHAARRRALRGRLLPGLFTHAAGVRATAGSRSNGGLRRGTRPDVDPSCNVFARPHRPHQRAG